MVLFVLLAGCLSGQEAYLDRATDRATATEIALTYGRPTYEQSLDTGSTLWIYRREGDGTGDRDFTPFCQELWLTFDGDRVLRKWTEQRC